MKKLSAILAAILFIMTGCRGNEQSSDDLITIDLTKSHPQKELILQDFMDVEYIALETNEEFVTSGWVRAIGKEHIIVINNSRDGTIYVFDKNGKGLSKFNHMGGSGVEYVSYTGIILDEDNGEIFVFDISKILVYDLSGRFQRSFKIEEGKRYLDIYNFDSHSYICRDAGYGSQETTGRPQYFIISKQDGSTIREIEIPVKQVKTTTIRLQTDNGSTIVRGGSNFHSIIPYYGNWILHEPSSEHYLCIQPIIK